MAGALMVSGQENLLETPGGRLEELIIKREFGYTPSADWYLPVGFQEREVNLLSGVNVALLQPQRNLIRPLKRV